MSAAARWRPTATIEVLHRRAALLAAARQFFRARSVLEVDTPALVQHAVTDVHIHSASVQLPGEARTLFLHTSPEYTMKRLLAAGSGDIFQIAHVFRGQEQGRCHNAEFTLIEWYRCGYSMLQLMREVAELTRILVGTADVSASGVVAADAPEPEFLRYERAFERELGLNPLTVNDAGLRACALTQGLEARLSETCNRDELLDWLMGVCVGPRLGHNALCFVHHYPASQAALARLDPEDARLALRFELYFKGIELANGFEELTSAVEQRARFEADRCERARRGLDAPGMDEFLLAALASGLPPACGVALGFERVLMLNLGAECIEQVLPFPLERA